MTRHDGMRTDRVDERESRVVSEPAEAAEAADGARRADGAEVAARTDVGTALDPRQGADGTPSSLFASCGLVRAALAGTLATAMALAGCAGGSAPIRYHVLAPVAPSAGAVYERYAGLPVVVRGLQLPPGADRTEMTRPVADGSFEIRESDRWAAPLGRLARQALVEDLALRLPARSVVVPGAEWPSPRLEVTVDVLSYRVGDGIATLALTWGLQTAPGGNDPTRPVQRTALRLEAPFDRGDGGGDAAVWSALMAQLADRIAAAAVAASTSGPGSAR